MGKRGDVPPVETWPDYFEKRESEHVRTNDLNGSNDSELGRVNYPLRQNDYDLIRPLSEEEIWDQLKKMKGNSCPGIDGISTKVLRLGRTTIMPMLPLIFSFVVEKAYWPHSWDISVAVPLFKKGNKMLHENFRSVLMGNVVSKLFCKVLEFRLRDWLDKEEILSPVQVGFRSTFSTVKHIFTLEILRLKYARGKNGRLFVAFLDLRSAFDSVNRRLLIESLLEIGLPSCFVAIIAAMYRRVKFVVKVMGKFSRLVTSHLGVKQ